MKFMCALMLATTINSCGDHNIRQQMLDASKRSEDACREAHGVPAFEVNHDAGTSQNFLTISRCDFPQLQLRGEGR